MNGNLSKILSQGPQFNENILKAFENRKLVFFIGAGVSRIMGIMGWDEFSAYLVKKAFPEFKDHSAILRDIPNSKERITIAYKKFEQEERLDEFYEYFGQGMIPDQNVFQSKENIYEILNRFEAIFLTTNADNLFEEVMGSALCHENCNLTILKSETQRRQNHLFYLHGHYTEDTNKSKCNLVFTANQYVERYNDPDFNHFLEGIFEDDNTIVFIGYGLNEFELIDYVVTKSKYTSASPRNVYVLHPFCQNDDLLFEVKKSYFEALNIEIIPYDISKNGYDSLIDILNALYDDYQKRTIVPITETISNCIAEFNSANYATIKRYVSDPNLAPTTEVQITQEIQETRNKEWVKCFYRDGLYSSKQMDTKIAYRAWPLLELLVDWVKSDEVAAQKVACAFLEQISPEQIKALRENYSFINKNIAQMILALDKDSIQDQYLDLLIAIGQHHVLFGLGLEKLSSLDRLVSWDWKFIKKIFDWLFAGVDINSFRDENAYIIDLFFKQFNAEISNDIMATNVFEYFKNMIIITSPQGEYNLFTHIHDVDHIYKNHNAHWEIILTELNYAFSQASVDVQKTMIRDTLKSANAAMKKIGLYLARKHSQNVSSIIVDSDFFNCYSLYHECYLLLKNHMQNQYLDEEVQDCLCDIISEAAFEIDTYEYTNAEDSSYYNNLILSKRLTLLLLLSNEKSKKMVDDLSKKVLPYPTVERASDCDYVHSSTWVNSIAINSGTFEGIPYEKWTDKLNELCREPEDDFSISDCGSKFSQLLLSLNEDDINTILPTLKNLSPRLMAPVLYGLKANKNELIAHTAIISSCLDMLNEIREKSIEDKEIPKAIFSLLSNIDIQDGTIVARMLDAINPWLYKSIDEHSAFTGDTSVLTDLINYGDFDKFGALLNCYVAKKALLGDELNDQERELLLYLLEHDNDNKFTYTMCYYYQRLKYVSLKISDQIFEAIFSKEPFNMTALVLCTLNSRYLFKEILEKIETMYLLGSKAIPVRCKDRILSDRFYSYIISARYENVMLPDTFEKAYADCDFVKYFLRSISMWAGKPNFDAEKWLIPCWHYIESNYISKEYQEISELFLRSADDITVHTEALLDMYIDIVSHCESKQSVYVKITKLLPFLEVNKTKANVLYQKILNLHGYVDRKELEEILSKYKEHSLLREGIELLNKLTFCGKISTKEKEQLSKSVM